MSTQHRTRTSTFIHRTIDGEHICTLVRDDVNDHDDALPNDEGARFATNTHVHVGIDTIGFAFDNSEKPRSPKKMASTSPGAVIVPLGDAASLILDPATARKLAKVLNAAARAADKLAAEEA